MIKEFLEGETYRHPKHEQAVFVLGIGEETDEEVTMAILWVDIDTMESTRGDELTVLKKDFKDWELMEL